MSPPPYGRELIAARRRGPLPSVFIQAGDHAWRRSTKHGSSIDLCLPPDAEDFSRYSWECIEGLSLTLVVWNRDAEFVDQFARHLILSGAASVAAIGQWRTSDNQVIDCGTIYYKPAPRAA